MRFLVLGGAGMLGHQLYLELQKHGETFATLRRNAADYARFGIFKEANTRSPFDATSDAQLEAVLRDVRPDIVFNCIAAVRPEQDVRAGIEVNSILPRRLAALCGIAGIRMIHVSTDGVFSGRTGNYDESAVPDAEDLYGRSKLLGEVVAPHVLTIRTCVVGRELGTSRSLIEWFLSMRGTTVRGYTRAIMNGFTAPALARLLTEVALHSPSLHGIWHLGGESISKYALLQLLNEALGCRTTIEPDGSIVCNRGLDGRSLLREVPLVFLSWPQMIAALTRDGACQ
jgi:dTDP-4-dehydrorhamnose reductase